MAMPRRFDADPMPANHERERMACIGGRTEHHQHNHIKESHIKRSLHRKAPPKCVPGTKLRESVPECDLNHPGWRAACRYSAFLVMRITEPVAGRTLRWGEFTKDASGDSHEKTLPSRRAADGQHRRPRRQFGCIPDRRTQDPHRDAEELRQAVLPPDICAEPLR